jgi:hypothetical protein
LGCGRFVVNGRRGATASRHPNDERAIEIAQSSPRLQCLVGCDRTASTDHRVRGRRRRLGACQHPSGSRGGQSGQKRDEARDNVIDALREVLAVRFGAPPSVPDTMDSESVELAIAA